MPSLLRDFEPDHTAQRLSAELFLHTPPKGPWLLFAAHRRKIALSQLRNSPAQNYVSDSMCMAALTEFSQSPIGSQAMAFPTLPPALVSYQDQTAQEFDKAIGKENTAFGIGNKKPE